MGKNVQTMVKRGLNEEKSRYVKDGLIRSIWVKVRSKWGLIEATKGQIRDKWTKKGLIGAKRGLSLAILDSKLG